jgi:hypothetical protein
MGTTQVSTGGFNPQAELRPCKEPDLTREIHANFPPGAVIKRGTILGQTTASANEVQTVTIAGTMTAGTFDITVNAPSGSGTAAGILYTANGTAVQVALQAILGAGNSTVSGNANGPFTITFTGVNAARPIPPVVVDVSKATGATGATVARTTVGALAGTSRAYVDAAVDGSGVARTIAHYDCVVNSAGKVIIGTTDATTGQFGEAYDSAPVYVRGVFLCRELVGLDQAAINDMNARLESGSVTDGILRVGC